MSEITNNSKLLEYKDRLDAQEQWATFVLSEMSSLYSDEFIQSTNYMVIVRELANLFATSELLFEKTSLDNYLETVRPTKLFQNFGVLIADRPAGFSDEDYRTFLKTIIKVIFNGFTIVFSKTIPEELNSNQINLFYPKKLKNTSVGSKGMNHKNAILSQSKDLGFILSSVSDGNMIVDSSRNQNRVILETTVNSSGSFDQNKLNLIVGVVDEILSSIVMLDIRIIIDSKSSITISSSKDLVRYASFNNFADIMEQVTYVSNGVVGYSVDIESNDFLASDSYDLGTTEEGSINPTYGYSFVVEDTYDIGDRVLESFEQDNTPPDIDTITPTDGADLIHPNSLIKIVFTESLDPTTITSDSVKAEFVGSEGVYISATTPSYDDNTKTVTLDLDNGELSGNLGQEVRVIVTVAVKDPFTNSLESEFNSTFTLTTDLTSPTVLSVDPNDEESGVLVNSVVTITFSEDIDPTTVNATNFKLKIGEVEDALSISQPSADVVELTPTTGYLTFGASYVVFVSEDVSDPLSNPLGLDFESEFATEGLPIAPAISGSTSVTTNLGNYEILYTHPGGVDYFRIYKDGNLLKTTVSTIGVVIDLFDLYLNQTANFQVVAVKNGAEGVYSSTISLTKEVSVPVFDGSSEIDIDSSLSQDVSWTSNPNLVLPNYYVLEEFLNGSSNNIWEDIVSLDSSGLGISRSNGQEYSYKVRAKVDGGSFFPDVYGEWSAPKTIYTRLRLDPVSAISPVIQHDASGNWTISWDPVPFATFYKVRMERRASYEEDGDLAIRLTSYDTNFTFDGSSGSWEDTVQLVTIMAYDDEPHRHPTSQWSDYTSHSGFNEDYPYMDDPISYTDIDDTWVNQSPGQFGVIIETADYQSPGMSIVVNGGDSINGETTYSKEAHVYDFQDLTTVDASVNLDITAVVSGYDPVPTHFQLRIRAVGFEWTYTPAAQVSPTLSFIDFPIVDDFELQLRAGNDTTGKWSSWSNILRLSPEAP